MKTLIVIFSLMALVTLNSCNQKTDIKAMLDNTETRNKIFNDISGNHQLMTAFMENMQNDDHAMQMMQGNKIMMGNMMKGDGMQMMMKDSMMMQNMMHSMMKDGKMMGNMMEMMHANGMMTEDCMKSCMKIMGDKGMNMMGKEMMNDKEMKNQTSDEEHSEHH